MPRTIFQEKIPDNHCFGCGPHNAQGLRIQSYWVGKNESECRFSPAPHHSAGPLVYLNGGIIATLIDCHTVCTAIAKGYQLEGREIGQGETVWYVTGELCVTYKKPVKIDQEVVLRACITKTDPHKITLSCTLSSAEQICVEGEVVAVRVPPDWFA